MYNITVDASQQRHQQEPTASMAQGQHSAGNDVTLDMPSISSSQQESVGQVSRQPSEKQMNSCTPHIVAGKCLPSKCNHICLPDCIFLGSCTVRFVMFMKCCLTV